MSFSPKKPTPRNPELKWNYEPIPCNSKFQFWVAGRPVGAFIHYHFGSKPCPEQMSDGHLKCDTCAKGIEPTWKAYLPVFDSQLRKIVVLYGSDFYDYGNTLGLHQPLKVWRRKNPKDPVELLKLEPDRHRINFGPVPPPAQDIRPWCLMVWKNPDLSDYLKNRNSQTRKMGDRVWTGLDDMGPSLMLPPKAEPVTGAALRGVFTTLASNFARDEHGDSLPPATPNGSGKHHR